MCYGFAGLAHDEIGVDEADDLPACVVHRRDRIEEHVALRRADAVPGVRVAAAEPQLDLRLLREDELASEQHDMLLVQVAAIFADDAEFAVLFSVMRTQAETGRAVYDDFVAEHGNGVGGNDGLAEASDEFFAVFEWWQCGEHVFEFM